MLNNKLRLFILAGASLALLSASALAVEFKPYGRGLFRTTAPRSMRSVRSWCISGRSPARPARGIVAMGEGRDGEKTADFVFVNTDSKKRPAARSRQAR